MDADGLGDRNRSPSPEGETDWGTLLTTLTPDPQPPSVGSSFASASASAATTQRTAAAPASSRTSFTSPDTAENSSFEHPCESGCDNSDTEGDEDDEMDPVSITSLNALRRSSTLLRNSDDPVQLDSWQMIVRNLARREDIPDDWWAGAGLSRMPVSRGL